MECPVKIYFPKFLLLKNLTDFRGFELVLLLHVLGPICKQTLKKQLKEFSNKELQLNENIMRGIKG